MKVKIQPKERMNAEIAKLFIDTINANPKCVLGLATGSSPVGVYKLLIEANKNNQVSFKDVTTFNLDEYFMYIPVIIAKIIPVTNDIAQP